VFLSLPMDLLGEEVEEVIHRPTRVPAAGLPPPDVMAAAVQALSAARRPLIVAGDHVADRQTGQALVALAEALGAPVFAEPLARTLPFPADHPLFAGFLPPFAPYVRLRFGEADLVLVVGGEAFLLYPPYEPGSPFPPNARVVHIGESAHEVGKVHPVDVGMVGDLGLTLAALLEQLGGARSDERRAAVESELAASRARLSEQAAAGAAQSPPTAGAAMNALAPVLRGRVVVDEAVSSSGALHTAFPFGPPAERFGHRAGGLGWGLPAAMGVALARPGQQVVSVLGDGSVMYAVQGLWSASHHELPILFVVLDNGGYEIIRAGLRRQGGEAGAAGSYLGMDVSAPSIEWGSVASAFGLRHASVERASEVCEAASSLLAQGGPSLLRVPIATGFRLP
jgi:benzoylformate decarboxylase